jgi:hypothetical protein
MHRHRLHNLCALPGERIPQPEGNTKKSDATGARIKVEEVVSLQAASALYHQLLCKEFVQNVGEPLVSLRLVPRLCFGSREPSAEQ